MFGLNFIKFFKLFFFILVLDVLFIDDLVFFIFLMVEICYFLNLIIKLFFCIGDSFGFKVDNFYSVTILS